MIFNPDIFPYVYLVGYIACYSYFMVAFKAYRINKYESAKLRHDEAPDWLVSGLFAVVWPCWFIYLVFETVSKIFEFTAKNLVAVEKAKKK